MALLPPGETEPQDKAYHPLEGLQSSSQHLAAYYAPFPAYDHYRDAVTVPPAEQDFQPFPQLEAGMSASQAMTPFPFPMAPPLLSPGLALQPESLYNLPWYSKLSPWYPTPHLPREVQHFPNGQEYTGGADCQDVVPVGGLSNGGQCWRPETLTAPTPVVTSLLPEGLKTSQLTSAPKARNQEEELPLRRFHFTQEELHFVLYGVTPSPEHPAGLKHAISGILVPTISSGKLSPHHLGGELEGVSVGVRVLKRGPSKWM